MNKTAQFLGHNPIRQGGTAASSFHLSETLDWSSLSARIKNRTVVLPASIGKLLQIKPPALIKHPESLSLPTDPLGKSNHFNEEWIKELPGSDYAVIRPIPADIEFTEHGECIARFKGANLAVQEDTKADALESLRYDIVETFAFLSDNSTRLGPALEHTLCELQKHVKKL